MKMKRMTCLLLAALLLGLFAACTRDGGKEKENEEPASLEQVTQYGSDVQEAIDGLGEGGVYKIEGKEGTYLVFKGADRAYSGVTGQVDGDVMTVNFHSSDGTSELAVFEIKNAGQVDSILLLDNGQQVEVKAQ